MPVRTADAEWKGSLFEGAGTLKLGSGAYEGSYTFKSRMQEGVGTNPEELIGAAHAGCFSMALSAILSGAGHVPTSVKTGAKVHFDKVGDGFSIAKIELTTVGDVPGLTEEQFVGFAEDAKKGCPVSKALTGTEIVLAASLA